MQGPNLSQNDSYRAHNCNHPIFARVPCGSVWAEDLLLLKGLTEVRKLTQGA